MTKIVALSGTHGTGKSSILKGCEGFVRTCTTGLSRSVQAAQNKTLAEILTDADSILSFQEAIFDAMVERDRSIMSQSSFNKDGNAYALGDSLVLVERSPYDLIAYTKTWLGPMMDAFYEDGDWARYGEFMRRCMDHAAEFYRGIILVPAINQIPFVHDPNRGSLESRELMESNLLHQLIYDTEFVLVHSINDLKAAPIANAVMTTYAIGPDVSSIQDRVEITLEAIRKMVKE